VTAGIGLAYVDQTTKATRDNYQQTQLIYQQQQLTIQDEQLGERLSSLSSASLIISEADRLGMLPGGAWTYVKAPGPSSPAVVAASPPTPSAGSALAAAQSAAAASSRGG
jgi:hypothetical protein